MHGFSDASELAYGACIYLRSVSDVGQVKTQLLTAKSRVTPLKAPSIPRLELCAAVLLSELVDKTKKCLTYNIEAMYLWSDSTIQWSQSCSREWATFVENRVGIIQKLTPVSQ